MMMIDKSPNNCHNLRMSKDTKKKKGQADINKLAVNSYIEEIVLLRE
jgi:hypothetical protein